MISGAIERFKLNNVELKHISSIDINNSELMTALTNYARRNLDFSAHRRIINQYPLPLGHSGVFENSVCRKYARVDLNGAVPVIVDGVDGLYHSKLFDIVSFSSTDIEDFHRGVSSLIGQECCNLFAAIGIAPNLIGSHRVDINERTPEFILQEFANHGITCSAILCNIPSFEKMFPNEVGLRELRETFYVGGINWSGDVIKNIEKTEIIVSNYCPGDFVYGLPVPESLGMIVIGGDVECVSTDNDDDRHIAIAENIGMFVSGDVLKIEEN